MSIVSKEEDQNSIYPTDNEVSQILEMKNLRKMSIFYDTFFKWKGPLFLEKFLRLMEKTEYKSFFEGLKYEYGTCDYKQDLNMAFSLYKKAADFSMDVLSMFRMFFIYLKDYKKFNVLKDKILEHFYFFKAYAFSPMSVYDRYNSLANRYDIVFLLALYIDSEEEGLDKFHRLIEYLTKNHDSYNIPLSDLELIKALVDYRFDSAPNARENSLKILYKLGLNNNLEAIYKFVFINISEELSPKTAVFLKVLIDKKYTRAFEDIGKYYYQVKKDKDLALYYLDLAYKNGYLRAGYYINDIILNDTDFCEFKITDSFISTLNCIITRLLDDIIIDNYFSYFELIFMRKIFKKHFKLEKPFSFTVPYLKELYKFLKKITADKENIEKDFYSKICLSEFPLALGVLQYYGLEAEVPVDYNESLINLSFAFKSASSNSYKRFALSLEMKALRKLFSLGKINAEEIEKKKHDLFNIFSYSLKENSMSELSSSFMYFLARMYEKGWGTSGNDMMSFVCFKRATEAKMEIVGTGSFISYYRKSKAKKKMLEEKMVKFKETINKISPKDDNEGYGEDSTLCPVCMYNKRDYFILPCKHKFCEFCVKKLKEAGKCALCRGLIFYEIKINC